MARETFGLGLCIGAAAYLFRDVLPYNRWIALACLIFGLAFLRTPFAIYAAFAAIYL